MRKPDCKNKRCTGYDSTNTLRDGGGYGCRCCGALECVRCNQLCWSCTYGHIGDVTDEKIADLEAKVEALEEANRELLARNIKLRAALEAIRDIMHCDGTCQTEPCFARIAREALK